MGKRTNKANWTGTFPENYGTGTCSSNAVTINAELCLITSETLSTAADGVQALTLTNSKITTGTTVRASLVDYSGTFATNGNPVAVVDAINTGNGTASIVVINTHGSNALNGVVKVLVEVITLPPTV